MSQYTARMFYLVSGSEKVYKLGGNVIWTQFFKFFILIANGNRHQIENIVGAAIGFRVEDILKPQQQ